MLLRARQFEFAFPRPAMVVGIINVTPDSFSDGGRFFNADAAVSRGMELIEHGAEILDIGGESTRPGAAPVGESEELRRVIPVIERLAPKIHRRWRETPLIQDPQLNPASAEPRATTPVLISIDTRKPTVAKAALEAGASMVNDVGANREDETMWRLVAETGAAYVCMHMQGSPQTMQTNPVYSDVVQEVEYFFHERLQRLNDCGVASERVIFDPGIGFGKTIEHNLQLLGALGDFARLGRPLMLGVSRKGFIGKLAGADVMDRLPGSIACACLAVESGVQLIRAHDVHETIQAVRMTEAILAQKAQCIGKLQSGTSS